MAIHPARRARVLTLLAALVAALAGTAAQTPPPGSRQPQGPPLTTFRSGVDLVTVNVVVRDKAGNVVRGLTRDDFTITEDGRRQAIETFDFEELDSTAEMAPPPEIPTVLGRAAAAPAPAAPLPARPTIDLHGRRLIVLFFDLSSMQPEELQRAFDAARDYIDRRLSPADAVAIASFSTSLTVDQDFTADRAALAAALDRLGGFDSTGFEEGATPDTTSTDDTAGFTPDDTEFNIFNTDRRLEALRSMTDAMAGIEQKKSLVYFSSGMSQTGMDNRVAMRAVIDRAVRANVSIYAADMRGLQAIVPGGDAQTASVRGVSAFSGRAVSNGFDQVAASQDALSTLSEDTGGRAFFDRNDFGVVFDRIVADTSAYYVIGYTSTNPDRDGRFRRIRVQVRRPDMKLEYRAGYYAPRDFAHSGRDDREQQLVEQLFSDLSVTDLPVYAAAAHFRIKGNRFFVPLWLVVPGSRVPFARAGDKERATLDILGILRDAQQRPVARIRDTVKLSLGATEDVRRKNVQYQTDFELPPGSYQLKVVVRENQDGTMGSFETTLEVPALDRRAIKVSSVVLGNRLQATTRKDDRNPLVRRGEELVANVAHVVSATQHLYLYYELYDPAQAPATASTTGPRGIRVLSNVVFFRNQKRVFETPLAQVDALTIPSRNAAAFQVDVPASDLPPGLYTCQVNIIDDVAGTFAFPRVALYVRR